jgi:hypothetical protein
LVCLPQHAAACTTSNNVVFRALLANAWANVTTSASAGVYLNTVLAQPAGNASIGITVLSYDQTSRIVKFSFFGPSAATQNAVVSCWTALEAADRQLYSLTYSVDGTPAPGSGATQPEEVQKLEDSLPAVIGIVAIGLGVGAFYMWRRRRAAAAAAQAQQQPLAVPMVPYTMYPAASGGYQQPYGPPPGGYQPVAMYPVHFDPTVNAATGVGPSLVAPPAPPVRVAPSYPPSADPDAKPYGSATYA